jgi:predicted DNA binding protein
MISEQDSRISITLPQDRDARPFIAQLRDQYPDITLVGRQDATREGLSLGPRSLLDHLTTHQQEVLKAAYYGGFFDQPRKSTGSEIAESLGISQPAFSKQLRKSERDLLTPLYDPD